MMNCRSSISISLALLLASTLAGPRAFANGGHPAPATSPPNPAQPAAPSAMPPADTRIAARCVQALTDVMIHDITAPPVASRSYVYSLIAFYEAARPGDTSYKSFGGRLNELGALPKPEPNAVYNWLVAGAESFREVAYTFVFSKELFRESWDSINMMLQRPIPKDVYDRSMAFGHQVATSLLAWIREDHYSKTRSMTRFTPGAKPGEWQQTGPDYMEAVEPHWDQIRPLTLTKAHQFSISEPAPFGSAAYKKEVKEVFDTSAALTDDQTACARFWDCNPYATQTIGHLMYSVKKISPGGHWIGITTQTIATRQLSLTAALYAYSLVGIAVFDGFISAWDEKYRTNYVRPITAIQQSLSPTWQPLLQTPPFPEYPSAHSVISMASATILTALYGDGFHYTDSTEIYFGLPARSFSSFKAAAKEAAVSRMYGGIHFREAIVNGEDLGRQVGEQLVTKLSVSPL